MRINTGRRRWIVALACVACIAWLTMRATVGVYHYLVTPRPTRAYASPDGQYRCVVSQSPWDQFTIGAETYLRIEDASGHVLPGGDLGQTNVRDVLWYDDMFVAFAGSGLPTTGICHHGRIYSQADIATLTSDNDLAEFADCKNLHSLTIRGPGVTDAGLAHLHRSSGLITLCADRAGVTVDGLRSLHQALPDLKVFDRVAATQPISFEH